MTKEDEKKLKGSINRINSNIFYLSLVLGAFIFISFVSWIERSFEWREVPTGTYSMEIIPITAWEKEYYIDYNYKEVNDTLNISTDWELWFHRDQTTGRLTTYNRTPIPGTEFISYHMIGYPTTDTIYTEITKSKLRAVD